jgi:HK97 family phage major capsid protein
MFQPIDKFHESGRASYERNLQKLYPELGAPKAAEKFSMVRMLNDMALRQFHAGTSHEASLCDAAARAQGGEHDPQRAIVPWGALLQQRDLNTSVTTAGGHLVGGRTIGALDVLRPYSVAARMGIRALENNMQSVTMPSLTGAVTGQWLASETTAITSTDPTIGVVNSKPKTAGALMRASRQFMLMADNAEAVIREQLLGAMGALLDQAILSGSGASGQPTGIVNTAGIGAQTGAVTLANMLDILQTLGNANVDDESVKFLTTPAVRRILQARESVSTSGRMIWEGGRLAGTPAAVTTDCPAATILAGDWSQCLVAFWGNGLEIQVDPYTSFATGAIQVRALMFADVNILKPAAFVKHTAVT